MGDSASVTGWIEQLRSPEPAERESAAAAIWRAYFPRLLALARERLEPGVRARADEEDVLQSMYKSFCLRYQRGEFVLDDRDALWRLLVQMTLNKVRNAANHHLRDKRHIGRERRSIASDDSDAAAHDRSLEAMSAGEPTPAEALALQEEMLRRLEALPADLRRVALWKLEGHTNAEIAGPGMLDCAERTVERKLALIRETWTQDADAPPEP